MDVLGINGILAMDAVYQENPPSIAIVLCEESPWALVVHGGQVPMACVSVWLLCEGLWNLSEYDDAI